MALLSRYTYILLIPLLLAACNGSDIATLPVDDSDSNIVEIREYEGEKLSSTGSMRENSLLGPQEIDIDSWRLKVEGLVDRPREYTYQQLLDRTKLKRVVWLHCVDGWSAKILWEGFSLGKLLKKAFTRR